MDENQLEKLMLEWHENNMKTGKEIANDELFMNSISQFSTTQLKAELRRRKGKR